MFTGFRAVTRQHTCDRKEVLMPKKLLSCPVCNKWGKIRMTNGVLHCTHCLWTTGTKQVA